MDVMSAAKRSALMARIRGRDTGPERRMAELLSLVKHRFETQARDLPGRPDFVFRRRRVAVFVDGDFWHGWRFPAWQGKLSPFWQRKIAATRLRDRRVHARLRRMDWIVVRIWEHQLKRDEKICVLRIRDALTKRTTARSGG